MKTSIFSAAFLSLLIACSALSGAASEGPAKTTSRQGGGFADGGLLGQYFANPDWKGEPAFSRRDVRLCFDWGNDGSIGGSRGPAYASFPRVGLSVKWTGSVIPRFSESYTFRAGTGGKFSMRIRPEGGQWTDLIDLKEEGVASAKPYSMTSGKPYEVEILYSAAKRPASCWLEWSSPNTPAEVIDPVAGHAINAATWTHHVFADYAMQGRWVDPTQVDDVGWPTSDARMLIGEMGEAYQGTYLIQFEGSAAVSSSATESIFEADGQTFPKETPAGTGYDSATNRTTLKLTISQEDGHWYLNFKDTRRKPQDVEGTGIRELRVMRPLTAGSEQSHAVGEIAYRPIKDAFAPYTAIRWLEVANVGASGKWEDRTEPAYFGLRRTHGEKKSGGECWERLVMLANECGKDLYICLPVLASDEYIRKLAKLLRYGSDGKEPYDKPVPNPVYPPLNPNLRTYVELGNEIWNWGFTSTQDGRLAAEKAMKENAPEAAIFNFDGKGNYRTWHAMRTAQMSDIFRAVFGDQAMGDRVRVLLEYQYDNANETARFSLDFLDAYYNKGRSEGDRPARAVKDIIWGAGGATYYGTGNEYGTQDAIVFDDPGFEKTVVPEGPASQPDKGAWKFTSDAGIYRNDSAAVTLGQMPEAQPLQAAGAVGFAFTVGDKPIYVRSLGRWFQTDDGHPTPVRIVRAADGSVVAEANVAVIRRFLQLFAPGFHYANVIQDGKPAGIKLDAKTTYYIVSLEKAGAPRRQAGVPATPANGIAVNGPVSGTEVGGNWSYSADKQPDVIGGPLDFRYTFSEEKPESPFPHPSEGSQAAYIRGNGILSTTLQVSKPGAYALSFHAAGAGGYWPGYAPFDIYANDEMISPKGQGDFRVAPGDGTSRIGGFNRSLTSFDENWGSAVFVVKQPGPVQIRIEGKGSDMEKWTVLDQFSLSSVDAIMESGFGAGSAFGQVAQANYRKQLFNQAAYAKSFGLEVVAYEAGWSLGGDFHSQPIQGYAKFKDPRAREINTSAMDTFTASGSFLNTWGVYVYWPPFDTAHAHDYPLMQSLKDLGRRLPTESENGVPIPGLIDPASRVRWSWEDGRPTMELKKKGEWKSWLVLASDSGEYTLSVTAAGSGKLEVEADGQLIGTITDGASAQPLKVQLTKGTHGIRLRDMEGEWKIDSIQATRP